MFQTLILIKQGGLTMIPIGLCSLAGLAVAIERAFALRRKHVVDDRVARMIDQFNEETSPDGALALCQRAPGAFARIIETVLRSRNLDEAHLIEAMHSTGRAQVGHLERGLTLLEIIGNVSPLLGLLGTVIGMVQMFMAIEVQGIGNPQVLSGGIGKALITTIGGLCVAIPALACHSWLRKRVDDFAVEMQERAMAFISTLVTLQQRKRSTRT
jgi:biopolymer transport protein ExbB